MLRLVCLPERLAAGLAAVLAAGCAGLLPGEGEIGKQQRAAQVQAAASGTYGPDDGYTLSAEEQKLDCKQLIGRMQVRILQSRDASGETSGASRVMQEIVAPVLGGSSEGADPEVRHRRDRAMLEAYNRQLAAKKCATFNLDAELAPPATAAPPAGAPARLLPANLN
ncbi:MAG: hypothetical protein ACREC6_05290 [Hyphomicrobiaceae bacterium]